MNFYLFPLLQCLWCLSQHLSVYHPAQTSINVCCLVVKALKWATRSFVGFSQHQWWTGINGATGQLWACKKGFRKCTLDLLGVKLQKNTVVVLRCLAQRFLKNKILHLNYYFVFIIVAQKSKEVISSIFKRLNLFLLSFNCCDHQFIVPSDQTGTEMRLIWVCNSLMLLLLHPPIT